MQLVRVRMSTRVSWISVAFGCAVCSLAARVGADARWLAAVGAVIARLGSIPGAVPYAAAPSSGWHDAPALGQLVFHWLEVVGGDKGLIVAQVVAVGIAMSACAIDMGRARAPDAAAAVVLLAAVVAAPEAFLVVRGQLFSLALFPPLLLLIRDDQRTPSRRIWAAIPLLVLWANLHGGVLVGFGILAVYLLSCRLFAAPVESTAMLVMSAGALLATPQLLHTAGYYRGVLGGQVAAEHYGLWAPLSLSAGLDVVLLAVAVPLLVLAIRSRPAWWEAAAVALLAGATIDARRNGIWLVLFVLTPAVRGLGRTSSALVVSRRVAAVCVCVPATLAVVGLTMRHESDGAGEQLLHKTIVAAQGSPILADPLDAEQLALSGARIWIGDPLDAFPKREQRLYLDWSVGKQAGRALLRSPVRTVLVLRGSQAQLRLASNTAFREFAADAQAVAYQRAGV